MKKGIIIIWSLIPFFASAQNDIYDKNFEDAYSTTEIGIEKHLIWKAYNNLDRPIETALIIDTRYYKPILDFNLDKSYNLSFTNKNDTSFKFFDDPKLDKMLFEMKPPRDFKWEFRKPSETKNLFEN